MGVRACEEKSKRTEVHNKKNKKSATHNSTAVSLSPRQAERESCLRAAEKRKKKTRHIHKNRSSSWYTFIKDANENQANIRGDKRQEKTQNTHKQQGKTQPALIELNDDEAKHDR